MSGEYYVYRFEPAPAGYLKLDGPFAYPSWQALESTAARLSYAQAHAYAAAYGGDVFHLSQSPSRRSFTVPAPRDTNPYLPSGLEGLIG